jgi:serine/threonine-protein kinase RsbW
VTERESRSMSAGPLAAVSLTIPSRPEYVGVARLAILGVASRMRFSYDEVEDIRLAVGEACTRAIDRLDQGTEDHEISIRCLIDANRLTIEVQHALLPAQPRTETPQDPVNIDAVELGGVLIRILMDEVETEDLQGQGAQVLRMVKYVAR